MWSALIVALWIILASAALGVAIGIVIVVPLCIYTFPYSCWVDSQQKQYNIPKQLESDKLTPAKKLFFEAKNATKLYRSWITKKPHNITRF